jgi:hypothetical protein
MKKLQFCLIPFIAFGLDGCKDEPIKNICNVIRIDNIVDLTHTLTPDFPFIPVKKLAYPF